MPIGTTEKVIIKSGKGKYDIQIENPLVLTAEIKDGTIHIFGEKVGKTKISLFDKDQLKGTIDVDVKPEIIGRWILEKYEYRVRSNSPNETSRIRYLLEEMNTVFDNSRIDFEKDGKVYFNDMKSANIEAAKYDYTDGMLSIKGENSYTYEMVRNDDIITLSEDFTDYYQNLNQNVVIESVILRIVLKRFYVPFG